ncbi:Putative syntaxin-24 [Apostasia shenzhenica]|uniref:Syntaxin-24 n=1 Tax=Apostasia shenzhenica TaxID=1088818 RepID=A0A2I0ATH0_9ASPA|nr:Putative syntaxin-24 [Apostasia shenzhenica]
MAEPNHSPLPGAYYGPPVPPQSIYPRRRRSICCGGPRCLLCTLFKTVTTIVVILGVAALILWLIFRPNRLKVYVENATLTQFNLTGDNLLHYDLNLTVSIRNPNRKIGIYYDYVEAQSFYDGSRFGFDVLPTFYQGHKNTTTLNPAFQGQNILVGDALATFRRESQERFFNLEVTIYTKTRLKAGIIKTHRIKPRFNCDLRLPAPAAGGSKPPPFERTKCDVDY